MPKHSVTNIEIRNDGVYVLINHNSKNVKNDILKVVQKYQVQDVDYVSIENAIKNKIDEQLISTNTVLAPKNESMDIEISQDKMKVAVKFYEPVNGGSMMTNTNVISMLNATGVRYGIDEKLIDELIENKIYGKWYIVAKGEKPTDGVDGYIEYFFNTNKKTLKPKVLPDGSVDYRNINLFDSAQENQKLACSYAEIPGKDGMSVFAKIIPSTRPKKAPPLPKGKNTKILEDGRTLVAEISGRIFYMDGRVDVLPILEISGDVDNGTGNIDFIGSVIIRGGVVSGFSVVAGADLEVAGPVEGASLMARGNIVLIKGVQGGGKAYIEAGGDITANFIESSVVSADGNITSNSILHSSVKCGGVLELVGKRGLFVGGKAVVGERIIAKVIGSSMATSTELEVGINPKQLEEYRTSVAEIEKYTDEFVKSEKVIQILSKVPPSNLPDDKKRLLMQTIRSKIVLKTRINETQIKIDNLIASLNKKDGRINASEVVYSGVKVTINNAVMYIRDNIQHCSLYNDKGKVVIGALV